MAADRNLAAAAAADSLLRPWAHRARLGVEKALRRAAGIVGYEFFRRHFDTPIPQVDALPERLWTEPSELLGIDLRLPAAQALLANELAPYLPEFTPPRQPPPAGGGFWLENGGYGPGDAEILWAMLRHAKPRRLVELGSGASSHVIAAAAHANAADGFPLEHRIFDPFPFGHPLGPVPTATVDRSPAEDIALATFAELEPHDVLFVDTTHTVKTGGDVTRLILDVLPRLAPGVLIHFHDIFLPCEYPREWVVDRRVAWAEQYLLQAFLSFNPEFQVILPLHALARDDPTLLGRLIASFEPSDRPGAFWILRRAAAVGEGSGPP
ncbi:MAG: class I SAM-dependent methyltransferase [Solirubrobacteraceae bacterium]